MKKSFPMIGLTFIVLATTACEHKEAPVPPVDIPRTNETAGEFSWYSPTLQTVEHALVKYRRANGNWAEDDHELINGAPVDVRYEGPNGPVTERLVAPGFTAKLLKHTPSTAYYKITIRNEEIALKLFDTDWWWANPWNARPKRWLDQ